MYFCCLCRCGEWNHVGANGDRCMSKVDDWIRSDRSWLPIGCLIIRDILDVGARS